MAYTILIVDDSREVIRVLESGIAYSNHEIKVRGVLSGEEAVLEARLQKIDLLVSDYRLPGITGLELMTRIKEIAPDIKIILITGETHPKVKKEVAEAGADAFFLKPIDQADFLDGVEQLLGLLEGEEEKIHSSIDLDTQNINQLKEKDEEKVSPSDKGVSDRLTRLKQKVKASSVMMLGERGQIIVSAGELRSPDFETVLIPSLMSAFSAGEKVAHFLGKNSPENLYHFSGTIYDLIMVPVGEEYALLLTSDQILAPKEVGDLAMDINIAAVDVENILESIGVSLGDSDDISSVPPFLTEVDESDDPEASSVDLELEALINAGSKKETESDLDSFWEPSPEQSGIGSLNADALSYQQALQLGLAPEDE